MSFCLNRFVFATLTTLFIISAPRPAGAEEQTIANLNGKGTELDISGKMTPGIIEVQNGTAFGLVLGANQKISVAAGYSDGGGRAVAFSHGSYLNQAASGESPELAKWLTNVLKWVGKSPTPKIGLQPSNLTSSATEFLTAAGFEVTSFSPGELQDRDVDIYCAIGHDAKLTAIEIGAISGHLKEGGSIAVLSTPWAFAKKYPNFAEEFPGNQMLAGTALQFSPKGYSTKPLKTIGSDLAPKAETIMTQTPAKEEKSDLDELLERTYPMPEFPPLLELVDNWQKVPERAFPAKITINTDLEYSKWVNGQPTSPKTAKAGHQAQPLKFKPGSLFVGIGAMKAVVSIDDTDFKSKVQEKYETGIANARARITAQREEMRREVTILSEAGDSPAAPQRPVTRTALTSEVAANYGKQYRGDYMPDITNGKNLTTHHEIALGPIGGKASVYYGKKEAVILELWDKGPGARSGLEVGDIITKSDGKPFKPYGAKSEDGATGVPEQLGLAMVNSQATGQLLELTVKRKGEEEIVKVELPRLPEFSKTFPADCQRSSAMVEAAAQWLADNQGEDGTWRSNDYSSAWCAIALLATGDPKYKRLIKKTARTFADEYAFRKEPTQSQLINDGKDAQNNWKNCMVGIFLAEYFLATGDEAVLDAVNHCSLRMEARLHKNGRMGHSKDQLPYSEKGLVIINVHAHILWALNAQIQRLEWNWSHWDTSYQAVEAAIGRDGGVGYNFSARGGSQSGSRTGAMITAQILAERGTSDARKLSGWLKENHHQFPNTHAMTSLGLIYGVMGLKNSSESGYRKCMDDYRWMFSLVQPANLDHGSYYFGQRKNTGGDGYCNRRFVGNFVTVMLLSSHRNDTLWMLGNRKRGWFDE